MKLIKFFLPLLVFISVTASAQIAPSPDATSYMHNNTAEDLYRGYITESIPLCNVEANNSYNVPIVLSYQTRGIKVRDIASSVGLGWDLSAGGAITRVMRSQPDDNSLFYNELNSSIVKEAIDNSKKGYDFEKDIFYYSFPGGSGKFVNLSNSMGYAGAPTATLFYGLPYTDNKIEFNYGGTTASSWVITDTKGIKYYFGTTEESREITHSMSYEEGKSPKANADLTYISTWYLTKIEFPDLPSTDDITFIYERNEEKLISSETSITKTYDLVEDHVVVRTWKTDQTRDFTFEALVHDEYGSTALDIYGWFTLSIWSSIDLSGGSSGPTVGYPYVNGGWSKDETILESPCSEVYPCDQRAKQLIAPYSGVSYYRDFRIRDFATVGDFQVRSHQIYRKPDSPVTKKFISDLEMTTSRISTIKSKKSKVNFLWGYRQDFNEKLDQIQVLDHSNEIVHTFQMSYDYFQSSTCTGDYQNCKRLKLTSVSKNGANLASFGYLDEESSSYNLPERTSSKLDKYGYYNSSVGGLFPGISFSTIQKIEYDPKSPNYNAALLNYPPAKINIGGSTRNESDKAKANILWKINLPQGGKKEFTYSARSGGGVKIDNVSIYDEANNLVTSKSYTFESPKRPSAALNSPLFGISVTLYSHSPYLYYDYAENTGYGKVTITDDILGSQIIHESYSGSFKDYSRKSLRKSNWEKEEDLKESVFPYLPPVFDPRFGLPKMTTYKDESGKTYKEDVYSYEFGESDYTYNEHSVFRADNGKYAMAQSTQQLRPFYLRTVKNTSIENGVTKSSKTEFGYHDTHKTLLSSKETYEIDEEDNKVDRQEINSSLVKYYYPMDKTFLKRIYSQSVLNEMVSENIIGAPIQTVNAVKYPGKLVFDMVGASVTTFRKQHTFIKPYEVYEPVITAPQNIVLWGNDLDLVNTLGYNEQGLLANEKRRNEIEVIYDYDSKGYLKTTTIDPGPDALMRETKYTYKNLVGLKSITHPNGRKMYYEYDSRNRLHLTKDNEKNIIKRYRYNLASEENDGNLRASIATYDGFNLVNQSISLKAIVYGNSYGTPGYKWDNGQTGESASYRFYSPGEYTVSVKVTNPDHPDIETTATRVVTVYDVKASYAISAPNEVELCTSGGIGEFDDFTPTEQQDDITQTVDGSNGTYPYVWVTINSDGTGAVCQEPGYRNAKLEYKNYAGQWIEFSNSRSGELPEDAFRYQGTPFNIEIRGEYTDNCSTFLYTPTKSISIISCSSSNGGGTGGDGDGNGGDGTIDDTFDTGNGGGMN
ncbi:hypothetical protein [Ekhidna sp.]